MERTAIFPVSFDPFTRGHAALVETALNLFDRIVIGIGNNTAKQGLLKVENRKRLIDDIYRGNVKRRYNMVLDIVQKAHAEAYRMLNSISEPAGRQYNEEMDRTYSIIQSCVMLQPPERAYNIVLALLRLITSLNAELTCRYDFYPARVLAKIPGMLADIGIKDYRIDDIINVNVK